jgi:hypothetical protein
VTRPSLAALLFVGLGGEEPPEAPFCSLAPEGGVRGDDLGPDGRLVAADDASGPP